MHFPVQICKKISHPILIHDDARQLRSQVAELLSSDRHMDEYDDLTRQFFFLNNNVKRLMAVDTMSRVKVGLEIPTAATA
ncbi:hypothetical protein [Burkholderia cenocepacia]|uniref:hypothetical protein n=1 Tax=Burkholderia cenocepacia TaxID=95486 RepID=UPI002ABDC83B|nr:hypothetical protein [Burkholderia cenocepacia]